MALMLLIPRFVVTHNLIMNTLAFFQLYIYVFAAVTFFVVTLPQSELERQSGRYSLLLGALAGMLFFDLSLFGWLVMLALAVIVVRVPLAKTLRVGRLFVAVFIAATVLSLSGAYHGNFSSLLPAIETHFLILRQGVQMNQPGFREHFIEMFLSPQSTYFHLHLTFVFAAATLLVSIGTHLASLRGGWPGRGQLSALLFDAAFLFAVGLHVYALGQHPTFTPAESLSLLCVYYMFFRVVIEMELIGRAVAAVRCSLLGAIPVAFAATMLSIASPIDTYTGAVVPQREEGAVIRSTDQLVGDLLGTVTVIDSWDIYSVSLIAYHLKNVVFMMHGVNFSGPGYDYFERYFEPRLGGYRFLFPQYVAGVFPECRVGEKAGSGLGVISGCRQLSSLLGRRVANVAPIEPTPISGSYLYVLPAVEGGKLYERSAGTVAWVDARTLPRGELRAFLAAQPATGLRSTFVVPHRNVADSLGWWLVPADATELNATLNDLKRRYPALGLDAYTRLLDVVLESLRRGYAPYVMRYQGNGATQYILLAPAPSSRAEMRDAPNGVAATFDQIDSWGD
jgi:hypothetical protein